MIAAGTATERYSVEGDDADPDRQTLLFRYPAVTAAATIGQRRSP